MASDEQRRDWLAWESELRSAMQTLRDGGHERVLRLLELQAATAMHNAYCSQDIPFPHPGVPEAVPPPAG
ncbi:MAG: hypothetical protein ACTHNU_06125 [Gaiellales bacterium]